MDAGFSAETFLLALLEALPDPVIVVADDTGVVCANRPARGVLPMLRRGEPLALTLRDPDVLDATRRVLQTGRTETVSWKGRVPVERSFEVTVARLETPGAPQLVMLSLRDLTEARRLEHMRADFIANASHELRTPLASMLGFIETLQGSARDDAAARTRFLAIMAEQARRMARLVDDLLSLSRIERNLHVRPHHPVDLVLVARHVADTLAPLAAEQRVELSVEAEEPVVVAGERDEIVCIAENLIENAIKYGCHDRAGDGVRPGRIEVIVRRGQREGLLTVRDHGPGIAPHHLPRLTERFYRIDAGQSRAKGGTGLGLALVKHVVARHRGWLTIDSIQGEGSSFTAMLPLHASKTS